MDRFFYFDMDDNVKVNLVSNFLSIERIKCLKSEGMWLQFKIFVVKDAVFSYFNQLLSKESLFCVSH